MRDAGPIEWSDLARTHTSGYLERVRHGTLEGRALGLSKAGLRARDALVRDTLRAAGVPVCVTLAGGYAEEVRDTVEIDLGTVETFGEWR